ncbi:MAG TPA: ABC transporter permease, partial [Tabrizicola sp.]|nr:ABC transporter permease [Tabrizicola sp.]
MLTLRVAFWVLAVLAVAVFVMFRQSRFGWHVLAVGGNRKAARHGGIAVKRTIFPAYALAGLIVGLAGFLFAARQNSIAADTGIGMEFFVLTALVVGLGGFVPGRGAVVSVLLGFATIYMLNNVLVNSGYRGDFMQFVMGGIILVILAIDVRFRKNRHRLLASSYLDPVALTLAPVQGMAGMMPDEVAPALAGARVLGVGLIDGPGDVLLDNQDKLYCGMRDGRIHSDTPQVPHDA